MATSKEKTKKAASRLASLIQAHMDEAELTVAQRERNVRLLEGRGATAGSFHGKSSARVRIVRPRGLAVSR